MSKTYYSEIIEKQATLESAVGKPAEGKSSLPAPTTRQNNAGIILEGKHFLIDEKIDLNGGKIDDIIQYMSKRIKYYDVAIQNIPQSSTNVDDIIGADFKNKITISIMKSK